LTTALPKSHGDKWLAAFARGLRADQRKFGIALYGGDSDATRGPAVLSVAAIGRIARGKTILRTGAKPGDLIYVSGTLGDAALGLAVRKGKLGKELSGIERDYLVDRYRLPRPRVALGSHLGGIAHAMIDISDGLGRDAGRIATASGVTIELEEAALPMHEDVRHWREAVSDGEDYELCFTVAAGSLGAGGAFVCELTGLPLTRIGRVAAGTQGTSNCWLTTRNAERINVSESGWDHGDHAAVA
jgi:thiamine-monophosphate kinase